MLQETNKVAHVVVQSYAWWGEGGVGGVHAFVHVLYARTSNVVLVLHMKPSSVMMLMKGRLCLTPHS